MSFYILMQIYLINEYKEKFNYTDPNEDYTIFDLFQRAFDSSDKFTVVDKEFRGSIAVDEVFIEYIYTTPYGKVFLDYESDFFDDVIISVEDDNLDLWNLVFETINTLYGRNLNYDKTLFDKPLGCAAGRIDIS